MDNLFVIREKMRELYDALPEKPEWLALIRQATDTLARGDFEKVVLARATDVQCQQPVNAIALMAASRALNLNCYHFCMVFAFCTLGYLWTVFAE